MTKLKIGDKVSVFNHWHKDEIGVVDKVNDKKIGEIGPFVNVKLQNGQNTGMIPEGVCTLLSK